MNDISPTPLDERLQLARLDALQGYGYADIVVRRGISQEEAKRIVWSTEQRRIARERME
jgi:hypothetical protein